MSRYLVNRCICHSRSFKEVKDYAEENDITSIGQLQADDFCSCGCGLCIPYIELMFETGETEFEPGAYYKRKTNAE